MPKECHTIRWKISQSFDRVEQLSTHILEHIDVCDSCRQFARLNRSWEDGGRLSSLSKQPNPDRHSRIMEAVRTEVVTEVIPVQRLAEQSRRFALPVGLTVAACVIGFFLWPKEPEYQSEVAKIQSDFETMTAFMRTASEPLRFLNGE